MRDDRQMGRNLDSLSTETQEEYQEDIDALRDLLKKYPIVTRKMVGKALNLDHHGVNRYLNRLIYFTDIWEDEGLIGSLNDEDSFSLYEYYEKIDLLEVEKKASMKTIINCWKNNVDCVKRRVR